MCVTVGVVPAMFFLTLQSLFSLPAFSSILEEEEEDDDDEED